jgi:drug/metabolite transporter (DMT)-like permease
MASNPLSNPHFRLFAGAFLISFSPIFVRLVSVSPTTSAFYRTIFGAIALLVLLVALRKHRLPARRIWLSLGSAAIFFALDLWFWHRSVLLIGPGLATLIANLQVFFMIAAGMLLFNERPGWVQIIAAPLAIAGLTLIVGGDWSGLDDRFRFGIVLGILTAMSYAGYLLSMRHARSAASDPLPIVEVATVSALVALILGLTALVEGTSLAIPSLGDFAWLLAYGVLAHAVGWMLIASSLNQVPAAQVGIALLLQPALSLLWDGLFFQRAFSAIEIFGVALTLTAIYLGSQRRAR